MLGVQVFLFLCKSLIPTVSVPLERLINHGRPGQAFLEDERKSNVCSLLPLGHTGLYHIEAFSERLKSEILFVEIGDDGIFYAAPLITAGLYLGQCRLHLSYWVFHLLQTNQKARIYSRGIARPAIEEGSVERGLYQVATWEVGVHTTECKCGIPSCAEIPHLGIKHMPNLGLRSIWEAAPIERWNVRGARDPHMADETPWACYRCVSFNLPSRGNKLAWFSQQINNATFSYSF